MKTSVKTKIKKFLRFLLDIVGLKYPAIHDTGDDILDQWKQTTQRTVPPPEQAQNNGKIIERIDIEGTPFTAVKFEDEWRLTMGRYLMTTQTHNSLEEVKEYIQSNFWDVLLVLTVIAVDNYNNTKTNKEQTQNTETK